MDAQGANKIIASYMGCEVDGDQIVLRDNCRGYYHGLYTKSLDALVPVWEKLRKHVVIELCRHGVSDYHWCYFRDPTNKKIDSIDEDASGVSIQGAAAIATAKAIQELK